MISPAQEEESIYAVIAAVNRIRQQETILREALQGRVPEDIVHVIEQHLRYTCAPSRRAALLRACALADAARMRAMSENAAEFATALSSGETGMSPCTTAVALAALHSREAFETLTALIASARISSRPSLEDALALIAERAPADSVAALLAAGANVTRGDGSALCSAAAAGRTDICVLLLDAGADVHARGDEPLRAASAAGHAHTVEALLAHGARVHAFGGEALELAERHAHHSTAALLRAAKTATC